MNRLRPSPHIPSTPWSDKCNCCDIEPLCWRHANGVLDNPPDRPSEEEMLKRARARCARQLLVWRKRRKLFKKALDLLGDLADVDNR